MATQRKIFGRIPTYRGDWSEGVSVKEKFRFTYRGSEFQALRDGLTTPPLNENDELDDGWTTISNGIEAYRASEKLAYIQEVEGNPEFLSVYVDANGKLLWGVSKSGHIYYAAGLPPQIREVVDSINREIKNLEGSVNALNDITFLVKDDLYSVTLDNNNRIVKSLGPNGETIFVRLSCNGGISLDSCDVDSTNTPEFIKVTLDKSGKILTALRQDGTLVLPEIKSPTITDIYSKLLQKTFFNLDWFKGKRILSFGDSIFDTIATPTAAPAIVAEFTGAIDVNYAVASAGYSCFALYTHGTWGKEDTNVYNMMRRAYEAGESADLIMIQAGTNDWDFGVPTGTIDDIKNETMATHTSFYWHVHKAITSAMEYWPLAPILVIIPPPRRQPVDGSINTAHLVRQGRSLIDMCNVIKEMCDYYSIPYLDMINESNMHLENPTAWAANTRNDGLHPSIEYVRNVFAPKIIKRIFNTIF